MFSNATLKTIFERTSGHCHFCGDALVLAKYGSNGYDDLDGAWEADHVIQKGKGGKKSADNCLPTCVRCNRLRWHRQGEDLRELIFLGLIAKHEIKKGSELGSMLAEMKRKRIASNKKRRRDSHALA